jgi:hypothetical protein
MGAVASTQTQECSKTKSPPRFRVILAIGGALEKARAPPGGEVSSLAALVIILRQTRPSQELRQGPFFGEQGLRHGRCRGVTEGAVALNSTVSIRHAVQLGQTGTEPRGRGDSVRAQQSKPVGRLCVVWSAMPWPSLAPAATSPWDC